MRHYHGLFLVYLWVMLGIAALAGCISLPAPTPTPEPPTVTPTRDTSPRATPAFRTAPTLPPEWTKTFTRTPTITPTYTDTLIPTTTLSVADVCGQLLFALHDYPDLVVYTAEGVAFTAGIPIEMAVIRFSVEPRIDTSATPDGTTTPPSSEENLIPGGKDYVIGWGQGAVPGVYDWSASVTTDSYTDICGLHGTMTVVEGASFTPTATLVLLTPVLTLTPTPDAP